ncbi:Protein kinase domain/Protein tyrosine kinase [Novymonas esmeraldas]|uniref:non-specific serine/threonine protein kinase n=1 Tax=Novymonas esmeraldas TaxID=1808958 RepID=A0AAW0F416_9TRYP
MSSSPLEEPEEEEEKEVGWNMGPRASQSKEQYLSSVLPRFFLLHPFYTASSSFARQYKLDADMDCRPHSRVSQTGASASLYSCLDPPTNGTVLRLLGLGSGGVALHARRIVTEDGGGTLPGACDSSFIVSEQPQLPSLPGTLAQRGASEPPSSLINFVGGGLTDAARRVSMPFAIKFMPLAGASVRFIGCCLREARVLRSCDFFSILKLYRSFVTLKNDETGAETTVDVVDGIKAHAGITAVTMELELVNNGDLRAELETRARHDPKRFFTQRHVLLTFVQLVMAVYHLHSRMRILHRDIKAANVLLCSNGLVKLGDFGFSKPYTGPDGVRAARSGSFCGTPQYMAPEVWSMDPYGEKADMFSLGVVLFEMMELRRPFVGGSRAAIRRAVLNCTAAPPTFTADGFDGGLRSLVLRLLCLDPAQRPSAIEVLATPLMREAAGTLLGVVHREPVAVAERSCSSFLTHTHSSVTTRTESIVDLRSPLSTTSSRSTAAAATTSMSASGSGFLNLSREERTLLLADVRGVMGDVVRHAADPGRAPLAACRLPSIRTTSPSPPTPTPTPPTPPPPRAAALPSSTAVAQRAAQPPIASDVAEPHRHVLMSGILHKEDRKGLWKRRCLQLTSRKLRALAVESRTLAEPQLTVLYELSLSLVGRAGDRGSRAQKTQPLSTYIDCYAQEIEGHLGFILQSSDGTTLRFIPEAAEERDAWVDIFVNCIADTL